MLCHLPAVQTNPSEGCRTRAVYLTQRARQAEQQDVVNDAGITLSETQELPELSSEQDPCGKGRDEKLFTRASSQPTEHNLSSHSQRSRQHGAQLGVKLCVKQRPLVGIGRAAPNTQTPNTQTEALLQRAFPSPSGSRTRRCSRRALQGRLYKVQGVPYQLPGTRWTRG